LTATETLYRYAFGGYVLDTNICLPELVSSNAQPDCSILVKNKIPDYVDKRLLQLPVYYAERLKLLQLQQKNGWIFLKDNKHLEFVLKDEVKPELIRTYLLGSILAVMSAALDFFPLHAAAVLINGKAVLFCGTSGVGKSTLAAYFYSKKYTILSDDVTNIKLLPDGKFMAYQSMQRIKLSALSLNLIGADTVGLDTIPLKAHKFSYPVNISDTNKGYPLGAIVFPVFNDGELSFEKNLSLESKIHLNRYLFRKKIIGHVYSAAYKNTTLFKIALSTDIYTFSRPNNEQTIGESTLYIEKRLLAIIKPEIL
jgi:hypothetical protein